MTPAMPTTVRNGPRQGLSSAQRAERFTSSRIAKVPCLRWRGGGGGGGGANTWTRNPLQEDCPNQRSTLLSSSTRCGHAGCEDGSATTPPKIAPRDPRVGRVAEGVLGAISRCSPFPWRCHQPSSASPCRRCAGSSACRGMFVPFAWMTSSAAPAEPSTGVGAQRGRNGITTAQSDRISLWLANQLPSPRPP